METPIEGKELQTAFLKAKMNFPAIQKRGVNTYFKSPANDKGAPYMLYEDIVDAVDNTLAAQGLYFEHVERFDERHYYVGTRLVHAPTGQKTEAFFMALPIEAKPQATGAGITYAKRFTLAAKLGIAADADDDGNHANGNVEKAEPRANRQQAQPQARQQAHPPLQEFMPDTAQNGSHRTITEKQEKRLFAIATRRGWNSQEVKQLLQRRYRIASPKDIRPDDYGAIVDTIETKQFFELFGNAEQQVLNRPRPDLQPEPPIPQYEPDYPSDWEGF